MAKIVGVCVSNRKGTSKKNINKAFLEAGKGIKGDAHSGFGHRQISLLARESIDKMRPALPELTEGSFAENLTTEGINLLELPIGTELKVGESVLLRITQIGKKCHARCEIFNKTGNCIMPKEGIFAEVIEEGEVEVGDKITITK